MILATVIMTSLFSGINVPQSELNGRFESVCLRARDFSKPVIGFVANLAEETAWKKLQDIEPDRSKLDVPSVREQFGIITVRFPYKNIDWGKLVFDSTLAIEANLLRDPLRVVSTSQIKFGC
jgi:hypothetical protein